MEVNWILKNACESLVNVIDGVFESVTLAVNDVFTAAALFASTDTAILGICIATGLVAFSLLILFIMKQVFATYIMETDGDPDSDPLDLLMKASIVIALISCSGFIYEWILTMATTFGDELFSSLGDIQVELENEIFNILNLLKNVATSDLVIMCIFTLIYIIGIVILCIKGGLRGAELCLMKILFPFFALDIITPRRERWNAFFTSYLVTMFGYTLQILCFRLSSNRFCSYAAHGFQWYDILTAFAFLYLAIKAPKWLEKFVYTSGIGQTVSGGARSAAIMLPSVLRMIK